MIRFYVRKSHPARRRRSGQGQFGIDVEFTLRSGSITGVIGASGSGKTTLLRTLAGLTHADEGFLEVEGNTWFNSAMNIRLPPQKRQVGLVFQDYVLFPNLTVRQNVLFARNEREDADRLLQLLGLSAHANHYPNEISGGQQQRTALARALARRPLLLLLDEPFSALDEGLREQAREAVRAAHSATGVTTLLVSHDRIDIERLCDEVIELDGGRVRGSDFGEE